MLWIRCRFGIEPLPARLPWEARIVFRVFGIAAIAPIDRNRISKLRRQLKALIALQGTDLSVRAGTDSRNAGWLIAAMGKIKLIISGGHKATAQSTTVAAT
jgi:hypothetical protein